MYNIVVTEKDLLRTTFTLFKYIDEIIFEHSISVGLYSGFIAKDMEYDKDFIAKVIKAGLFHDTGLFNPKKIECESTLKDDDSGFFHSINGYLRLKYFSNYSEISPIVLYHHLDYNNGYNIAINDCFIPFESYIIRAAELIHQFRKKNDSDEKLEEYINSLTTKELPQNIINSIKRVYKENQFKTKHDEFFHTLSFFDDRRLTFDEIKQGVNFFAYLLDFASSQTSTHSFDVSFISDKLADKFKLPNEKKYLLELSSLLHDVGKLGVNMEYIEKPSKLTEEEYKEVMRHADVTKEIFQFFGGLRNVLTPAYNHHERMNGSGYPLGLKEDEMSLEDYIMQVADVFGALVQKRSYKDVFPKDTVVKILKEEIANGKLNKEVTEAVINNYEEFISHVIINRVRHIRLFQTIDREKTMLLEGASDSKYN